MTAARMGFMVSIAILVLSALPLAAHLLPGLFGDFFPKVSDTAHESWYGVLGKVLLMVPATWLTGFYTKTFADFFHLEREYAHKAALAMSVDGFKRQAPKYEEEITAEVFLEIRNNPAKGSPVEPASHPLYDVLSKVVGKVLDKKKE
jgi:glutathione peroxidase-family protein